MIKDDVSSATLEHEPAETTHPNTGGNVFGRPVEDRSFEVVETGAGLLVGAAVGAAVAGPIGAAVGGIVGAAGGFVAGEALERAEGRAAETTDATDR